MARYVALLRGVNVGGNALKMERVREICGELGLLNVLTYVQSGNIVFDAPGAAETVRKRIESGLAGVTRLPVAVVLRSGAELRRVARGNPFLQEDGVDRAQLYVTFLARAAGAEELGKLNALRSEGDRLVVRGAEVFVHCPAGYGRTKFSNNAIEKALRMGATTRNWKTVGRLCEMLGDAP